MELEPLQFAPLPQKRLKRSKGQKEYFPQFEALPYRNDR